MQLLCQINFYLKHGGKYAKAKPHDSRPVEVYSSLFIYYLKTLSRPYKGDKNNKLYLNLARIN